ncbi:MAG: PQQ-dependent sugar dehydrogenase [Actinomycetota bacterium]|nr:PQQ-dependent sugar dehydrogenase [Actinomycetota bacterium]
MNSITVKMACHSAIAVVLTILVVACGDTSDEASSDGSSVRSVTVAGQEGPATTTANSGTTSAEEPTSSGGPVEVEASVIATGLEAPWDLTFLPDGRTLVTERDTGRILSVDNSGNMQEVDRLPEEGRGEGGLLGLAPSTDYRDDGYLYAYYSAGQENRVVRFRPGEEPEPLLTGIPVNSYHDGGRIAFGPDGMLYVATGDAGVPSSAQDLNSLSGKILRLTPDGGIPADNPFPDNPTYSYGHRNVQGLAWDEDGRLYASEFGQNAYDEVNRIEAGGNYGWPEIEGEGGEPEYIDPIAVFSTAEASPSGAEIPKDSAIPQWNGDFFMAALRGERLWRLELGPDGAVTGREELLSGEFGRLRHVAQAPDGSLWVLTNNRDGRGNPVPEDDRIIRLAPADG